MSEECVPEPFWDSYGEPKGNRANLFQEKRAIPRTMDPKETPAKVEVVLVPHTYSATKYHAQMLAMLRECHPDLSDEMIQKGFEKLQQIWNQDPWEDEKTQEKP